MLNGLDLFSGYGGAQDALQEFVRTIAYCEIEQGAQRILLRRMRKGQINPAPIWDDVRTLRRRNFAAKIDIITGGFPCQDISVAGTVRRGLDGKRSGLFFEIIRLMGEFRPTFVYLENVTGLFTNGFDRVAGELAAARYDCRWGVLSAYEMGATHIRERVWILAADTDSLNLWKSEGRLQKCQGETFFGDVGKDEIITNSFSERLQGREWEKQKKSEFSNLLRDPRGEIEPTVRRGSYGPSDRRHRIRALGNGWVPQTAREAFNRLIGFKEEAV